MVIKGAHGLIDTGWFLVLVMFVYSSKQVATDSICWPSEKLMIF